MDKAPQVRTAKPTPDDLSLQQAFYEGQRAGMMLFGASLNPYQDDCQEHREWERARSGILGCFLNSPRARAA